MDDFGDVAWDHNLTRAVVECPRHHSPTVARPIISGSSVSSAHVGCSHRRRRKARAPSGGSAPERAELTQPLRAIPDASACAIVHTVVVVVVGLLLLCSLDQCCLASVQAKKDDRSEEESDP